MRCLLIVMLYLCGVPGWSAAEFSGIGVTVKKVAGGAEVVIVFPDGAAALSGEIKPGDLITKVSQPGSPTVVLSDLSIEQIVGLIRGEAGSEVELAIEPADNRVVREKRIMLRRAMLEIPKAEQPKVGSPAPMVTVTRLSDNKGISLKDFAGKVVVMDFWATWCGPCQAPMAKMQTYAAAHPEWGDRVVFLAVSVDRDRDRLDQHLEKRGWNKTLNVWDGEGAASDAYAIEGIPQAFVLAPDGTVAAAGHPGVMDIAATVEKVLPKLPPANPE